MPILLQHLIRGNVEPQSEEVLVGGFDTLKNLVVAGILLWSTLTPQGRASVKHAYQALQLKTPVATTVQQKIEDEMPYSGKELETFIQDRIAHYEKVEKEIGPVSQKILKLKYLFRNG